MWNLLLLFLVPVKSFFYLFISAPPSLKGYLEQSVGNEDFMRAYRGSFNMATSIGIQFLKQRWIFVNVSGFFKETFWKYQAKLSGSRSVIW